MKKHHVLSSAVFLAWASAVSSANTGNDEEITIDPNTVSPQTRMKWCNDQLASCATLCGDAGADPNSCDHNTLDYACTCINSTTPGLQYYTKTMPTYICEESYKVCTDAAGGDAAAEEDCGKSIKSQCGTLDPSTRAQQNGTESESTGTATTTATTSSSSSSSSSSNNTAESATTSEGEEGGGSEDDGSKSLGTKVGTGLASLAAVCVVLGSVAFVFYRRGKRHAQGRGKGAAGGIVGGGGGPEKREPDGPFEKLDSGDGWSSYELDTTDQQRPAEMAAPAPAFRPHAELESPQSPQGPRVFIAELDDTSLPRAGSRTVSERGDSK